VDREAQAPYSNTDCGMNVTRADWQRINHTTKKLFSGATSNSGSSTSAEMTVGGS